MGRFVALLRGVGPTNPNMRNEKLAGVFAGLGFTEIRPVIASGNLVFSSAARSTAQIEKKIERALSEKLDLTLDVIVRSQAELEAILEQDPFKGAEHGKQWYLLITFRKDGSPPVYSKLDRAKMNGPDLMLELEKRYSRRITSRTRNTVQKIVAKMRA